MVGLTDRLHASTVFEAALQRSNIHSTASLLSAARLLSWVILLLSRTIDSRQLNASLTLPLKAVTRVRKPFKPSPVLTIKVVNTTVPRVLDIQVIDNPAAATVALEPTRSRLLAELAVPASAATLATRIGLARQKVNYHLHPLGGDGLGRVVRR